LRYVVTQAVLNGHRHFSLVGLLILLSLPLVAARPAIPLGVTTAVTANLISSNAANTHKRPFAVRQTSHVATAVTLFELVLPPAEPTSQVAPRPPTPRPLPARSQPLVPANWILSKGVGLSQPVGWYTDCSGHSPVPTSGTWRWSCAGTNNTYIMAHNPGIFTPILRLHPGDLVQYGDPSGHLHTYRVTSVTVVANSELWPLAATTQPELTLQTCWTLDGSQDFIVRAIQT